MSSTYTSPHVFKPASRHVPTYCQKWVLFYCNSGSQEQESMRASQKATARKILDSSAGSTHTHTWAVLSQYFLVSIIFPIIFPEISLKDFRISQEFPVAENIGESAITSGHRGCFTNEEKWENSALSMHARETHSDNFSLENFEVSIVKKSSPQNIRREEFRYIEKFRTIQLGLNRYKAS